MIDDVLPERGTGLANNNAGSRRGGVPRTDEERLERHKMMTAAQGEGLDMKWKLLIAGLGFVTAYEIFKIKVSDKSHQL